MKIRILCFRVKKIVSLLTQNILTQFCEMLTNVKIEKPLEEKNKVITNNYLIITQKNMFSKSISVILKIM